MASDNYQESNLDRGYFTNGKWVCTCEKDVRWLTAKTDAHKGERFLRCCNAPQCKFFLWEKDEADARQRALQRHSDPQTPTRTPTNGNTMFPTPASRNSTSARHGKARVEEVLSQTSSAIPFQLGRSGLQPVQDLNLTAKVVDFLRNKGIELRASDQLLLNHIISTEVAVHEIRLQQAQETIEKLANYTDSG